MPTTYTHYRFGSQVFELLPDRERAIATWSRELFDIGLHGPDILFYYRPFGRNRVNELGCEAHTVSGREYFTRMWKFAQLQKDTTPYLAFLYGYLCHFTLDSACHGYVNEKSRTTPWSHSQIEAELDRYYMIADGKDPLHFRPNMHLNPSKKNAHIISAFFPEISEHEILESLRTMKLILTGLVPGSAVKSAVVSKALQLGGNVGLLMPADAPADCVGLLHPLIDMYERAIPRAVENITNIGDMAEGLQAFTPWFELPFDPQTTENTPAE